MKFLIINTGSASKKYALYFDQKEVFKIHIEREEERIVATLTSGSEGEKLSILQKDYDSSIDFLLKLLVQKSLIKDKEEINAIGLRVVAPGDYFLSNKIIDEEYLSKLKQAEKQAPLHVKPAILEIEQLKKVLPDISIIGVSDSAFHKTMPPKSRLYGLPQKVASEFEIYRYGYHGISAQSILSKIKGLLGKVPPKVIICHLGGGSSIHAVKDGESFDTSMGLTPLEGVVMATRVGDIGAGAVIYLAEKLGMGLSELRTYLNRECGLLGLSGKSDDIRELLELEEEGDSGAKTALEVFVYRIKKHIGSYVASLNGLDLLVFTATIGERSDIMRSRICSDMEALGIVLDEEKNNKTISVDNFIQSEKSPVKIAVMNTDEMNEIAKEIKTIV